MILTLLTYLGGLLAFCILGVLLYLLNCYIEWHHLQHLKKKAKEKL